MITIDRQRTASDLVPHVDRLFDLSAGKIDALNRRWDQSSGAPVFTVNGKYQARGWTDWTQGFQFGSSLLQFDATGDTAFLEAGRTRTLASMTPHLTHIGVHDHGFNTVSTYGALWRLAREGRFEASEWELRYYELALRVSGAVQARRWTRLPDGGFIHSFNGAHSLFVDTIRSLRALALAHALGHVLMDEQDLPRQPARAARAARPCDGSLQRIPWPRQGRLRCARPRDPRGHLQCGERLVPQPQHPAGILTLQHVDPWPRLGHSRLRRTARVPRDGRRRGADRMERASRYRGVDARSGARDE